MPTGRKRMHGCTGHSVAVHSVQQRGRARTSKEQESETVLLIRVAIGSHTLYGSSFWI